ncbi:hypothetical protein AX16_010722 [Volvariella volvacea WC 439]|nr:hypothetical protein AX16_010722 [Volvariella volvacea WC 439]
MVEVIQRGTTSTMHVVLQQYQHGPLSLISKLPYEILVSVFLFAKLGCNVPPHVLARVCRDWYSIAQSAKRLWTDIVAGPLWSLGKAKMMLERSDPHHIDLVLDFQYPNVRGIDEYWRKNSLAEFGIIDASNESWEQAYRSVFTPTQLMRCRSIVVQGAYCYTIIGASKLLGFMQTYGAPHLERFEFNTYDHEWHDCCRWVPWLWDRIPERESDAEDAETGNALNDDGWDDASEESEELEDEDDTLQVSCFGEAPRLHTISLSGVSLLSVQLDVSNVKTLTLAAGDCFKRSEDLATRFSKFNALETLSLDIVYDWLPNYPYNAPVQPVTLDCLKTLKFNSKDYRADKVLIRLYTPNLEHLIIEDFWPRDLPRSRIANLYVGDSIEPRYPCLTQLTLRANSRDTDRDILESPHRNPFIIQEMRYPIGRRYPDLRDITDFYYPQEMESYRKAIRDASYCFPNVQQLTISELIVNQMASAMVPIKGMDEMGRQGTRDTWVAWPELKALKVEANMVHWKIRSEVKEMKKKRREYAAPIHLFEMDYGVQRRYWEMDDLIEELERSRL